MAEEERPPAPADSSDLLPQPVRTLAGRLLQSPWLNRVAGALLLAGVAAGAAYLVTPGLSGPGLPYDDRSVGEVARSTIKADRDYDLPDEATTQRQRDDVASQVRPVYDYDLSVAQGALSRVRVAFLHMQEVVAVARAHQPPPAPAEPAQAKKPAKPAKKPEPAPAPGPPPELAAAMEASRDDFFRELQATLDEEDFRALAEAQFGGEVEGAVEALLRRFQDQPIATASDELAALGNRGITVRIFPSPAPTTTEAVLLGPGQQRAPGEGELPRGPQTVLEVADIDRVRAQLEASQPEGLSPPLQKAAVHLAKRLVRPNLTFKPAETSVRKDLARLAVKPVIIQVKKGDRVIGAGDHIDRHHALIFKGMRAQSAEIDARQVRAGSALLAAVLISVLFGYGRSLRRFRPTRKDVLLLACLLLGMLALVDGSLVVAEALHDRTPGLSSEALTYAVPFAAGAMLVRFVLGSEEALLFAGVFALLAALVSGNSLTLGLYAWVGSLVAAQRVAGAKDRGALFKAGLWTGVVNAVMVVCIQLVAGKFLTWETTQAAFAGFVGGAALTPVLVMGLAPLIESVGGYVTDIKLLELANLNHPALKELIVQAPGTYHHSIIMGSLVEAAAEAIGANPLLARVCAYYHDIGKGKNPLYFGENQKGENRHDKLAPQMSALIIRRHVTDGLEMARLYKLPKLVSDAIPQHHGTKLVGYFFHKAVKEAEANPGSPPVDEAQYRYPGPKPQYRETALVMIADAVEAASRALPDPTDANLQALVKKMINSIFADGQLDECDLTLKDLNLLAKSFYTTIRGIYHTRPEYPPGAVQPPRTEGAPTLRAVGEPDPKPDPKKLSGT